MREKRAPRGVLRSAPATSCNLACASTARLWRYKERVSCRRRCVPCRHGGPKDGDAFLTRRGRKLASALCHACQMHCNRLAHNESDPPWGQGGPLVSQQDRGMVWGIPRVIYNRGNRKNNSKLKTGFSNGRDLTSQLDEGCKFKLRMSGICKPCQ